MRKVYISFDEANDTQYRDRLEELCYDKTCISRSPEIRNVDNDSSAQDPYQQVPHEDLKDSSVTIVLIGKDTWKQKIIDREIYSSLNDTETQSRNGLLGIMLPTYVRTGSELYHPTTIPRRLHQNIVCDYATICSWTNDVSLLNGLIEDAIVKRNVRNPDNSLPPLTCDLSGAGWSE